MITKATGDLAGVRARGTGTTYANLTLSPPLLQNLYYFNPHPG